MNKICRYFKRGPNTFKKYFVAYLLILVIPILFLGSMFYVKLSSSIRNDIENYYVNKANSVIDYFEQKLKELDKICVNISFNKSVYPFNEKKLKHYPQDEIDNLVLQLSNAVNHIDIVDDIYLYLYGEDIIISSRGRMSLESLTETILRVDQKEKESMINIINNSNNTGFYKYKVDESFLSFRRTYQLSNDYNTLYLYPITLYPVAMSGGKTYGSIIFTINLNNISIAANSIMGDDQGCLFVINQDNELLFSLGRNDIISFNSLKDNINTNMNNEKNEVLHMKKDNSHYTYINLSSSSSREYKYVYVFSLNSTMKEVNILQRKTVWWIFYGSLMSLIFSYIISRINYKPIKSIASIIQKNINSNEEDAMCKNILFGDFESIKVTLIKMFNEKNHLMKTVDNQMPFVRDQIISGILKGKSYDNESYKDLFESCGISLNCKYYDVIFIKFSSNTHGGMCIYLQQILYTINNTLNEDTQLQYYCIESFDGNIIIILNSDNEFIISEGIHSTFENIQQYIQRQFETNTHIGISTVCSNVNDLHKCFLEALSSSHYKEYSAYNSIVYYDHITDSAKYKYWYPQIEHKNLILSINDANFELAKKYIGGIMDGIRKKDMPFEMVHCICFSIIKAIIDLFNEYNLNIPESEIELTLKFRSLKGLQSSLEILIENICNQLTIKKQTGKDRLRIEATNIILKEYKDSELTITKLSEKLNVSSQYLSKYLKENMGMRYTEFIRNVRIMQAKRLLSETNMPLKAVSYEVGYSDVSSFIRRFKEEEGMTPGEYRNVSWKTED